MEQVKSFEAFALEKIYAELLSYDNIDSTSHE